MSRYARAAGISGLCSFVAASTICGAMNDGYSHREHPLALLGAIGMPRAFAFNLFAFILPGALCFFVAWRLRADSSEGASWRLRVGLQLIAISALAFAAQGLLRLDLGDPGAQANAWHALAWTLWWIAFIAGAGLIAIGGVSRMFSISTIASAALVAACVLPYWPGAMAAAAPRMAFLLWLIWMCIAPGCLRASRPEA